MAASPPPYDSSASRDVPRTTFAVLLTGILILFSFWVLLPFLPALAWAGMIVIASWPIMLQVERFLGGSRTLAVIVMEIALVLVLLLPLSLALLTIIDNVDEITQWTRGLFAQGLPPPPSWLADIPLFGPKMVAQMQHAAMITHKEDIFAKLSPYIGQVLSWLVTLVGGVGVLFVHFALTVILAGVLYARGEAAASLFLKLARRLASARGEEAIILAAHSVRAVALGVVVTALIQSVMAAFGFIVADVPYPAVLSSLVFLLCIIQVGAAPVLFGVTIWLYENGHGWGALIFLVWSIMILSTEYLVRPMLMRRGANLPLLLIFAGVLGGLISFGIIGLFVGPAVLAVSFALLTAWIDYSDHLDSSTSA